MKTRIKHLIDRHRFTVNVEGHDAFVEYLVSGNTLIIEHAYVPKPIKGRGIAGELVEAAWRYAIEEDMLCQATCPYARHWLDTHR